LIDFSPSLKYRIFGIKFHDDTAIKVSLKEQTQHSKYQPQSHKK
jgi:hypothetical protein